MHNAGLGCGLGENQVRRARQQAVTVGLPRRTHQHRERETIRITDDNGRSMHRPDDPVKWMNEEAPSRLEELKREGHDG